MARARTPSGHDIPIPESVFQAIAQVQREGQETRAEVAGLREDVTDIGKAVKTLAARRNSTMLDMVKVLAPAVVAIVGGVTGMAQLTKPSAPEPTRIYESNLSAELVKCQAKPEGEQRFCVADAYENDKTRRAGRP